MIYNTICFDLDNTLFSHEYAFEQAIKYCFKEKFNLNEQDIFLEFKKNSDQYWSLFEEKKVDKRTYRRIRYHETIKKFNLPYSDYDADEFHNKYNSIVDQFSLPYEGINDFFSFIVQHTSTKIGIITNGIANTQYRKIEKLGLFTCIPRNHIFISDEVGISKPSKAIFDYALKEMRAKASYIYVGDAWVHDIVGSIDAGWDAIYLNSRNEKPSTSHTPLFIGKTFEEVSEWIKTNIRFSKG